MDEDLWAAEAAERGQPYSPSDPVLGKAPANKRDHYPIRWRTFLKLRAWAQEAARQTGAAVYLVGSALAKDPPRDVDIAVVWPAAEFARRFGRIPAQGGTQEMGSYVLALKHASLWLPLYCAAQTAVDFAVHVDVRFCPDTWWVERDRLLLAAAVQRAAKERGEEANG